MPLTGLNIFKCFAVVQLTNILPLLKWDGRNNGENLNNDLLRSILVYLTKFKTFGSDTYKAVSCSGILARLLVGRPDLHSDNEVYLASLMRRVAFLADNEELLLEVPSGQRYNIHQGVYREHREGAVPCRYRIVTDLPFFTHNCTTDIFDPEPRPLVELSDADKAMLPELMPPPPEVVEERRLFRSRCRSPSTTPPPVGWIASPSPFVSRYSRNPYNLDQIRRDPFIARRDPPTAPANPIDMIPPPPPTEPHPSTLQSTQQSTDQLKSPTLNTPPPPGVDPNLPGPPPDRGLRRPSPTSPLDTQASPTHPELSPQTLQVDGNVSPSTDEDVDMDLTPLPQVTSPVDDTLDPHTTVIELVNATPVAPSPNTSTTVGTIEPPGEHAPSFDRCTRLTLPHLLDVPAECELRHGPGCFANNYITQVVCDHGFTRQVKFECDSCHSIGILELPKFKSTDITSRDMPN